MKRLRNISLPRLSFLFLLGIIWFFSSCSPKPTLEKLKNDVVNTLSISEGDFAIAFKDLTTGETILINEKEVFHAASTMKTPVMIEVYKQVAEGKLSLSDSIEVINEFKSIVDSTLYSLDSKEDSEFELYNQVGTKKLLGDIVYDMIIASSNLATNIVIELVDAKKVTQTMRNLGAPDILVLRGVEDQKAYEAGLSNTTTAYDLMVIFEKLANGEAVSPEADQQMIDILLNQKFNEIIPAQLPKDVKVAHKTGFITGVQHDSALIILPDGRKYVLVTLSKNLKDETAGVAAMANASKLMYDYVVNK
ncbi:MAG: serine hydrolase [Cyclobacteriaceae bacterium]